MKRWAAAPSFDDFEGVGAGDVADYVVCDPFVWVGTEILEDSYATFYPLSVSEPGDPGIPPDLDLGVLPPRTMVLCAEDRDMHVYGDC